MGQDQSVISDDIPPKTLSERSLEAVAEYITSGKAKRIVVMTGAGISTAAGIPDFRSPHTGLYANLSRLNLPSPEAVFDISFFRRQPEPFYVLAKELYPGRFRPTVSHVFLSLLAARGLLLQLFTQNIDCLERAAGVPADLIVEAHGSFATQRCIDCGAPFPDGKMREFVARGEVPRCDGSSSAGAASEGGGGEKKGCGGLVKPDIVFFGEALPALFRARQHYPAMADLALVMGTSLQVHPFASLPESVREGVPRVLFNLERVGGLGSQADDVLVLGDCDAGVRKLADALGWREELEEEWRRVVGEEEAERQLAGGKERREREVEDEVAKLTKGVEDVLRIEDTESGDEEERQQLATEGGPIPPRRDSVSDEGRESIEGGSRRAEASTDMSNRPTDLPHVAPTVEAKETQEADKSKPTQEADEKKADQARNAKPVLDPDGPLQNPKHPGVTGIETEANISPASSSKNA